MPKQTLKRRADGRYQKRITLSNGKTRLVYGRTEAALKAAVRSVQAQDEAGLEVGDHTLVGEWAKIWLRSYKQGLRPATTKMYRDAYNLHIMQHIGCMELQEVRPVHIRAIMAEITEQSESLQHKVLITVRQIMQTAQANHLIRDDPTDGIRITTHARPKQKKYLTQDEAEEPAAVEHFIGSGGPRNHIQILVVLERSYIQEPGDLARSGIGRHIRDEVGRLADGAHQDTPSGDRGAFRWSRRFLRKGHGWTERRKKQRQKDEKQNQQALFHTHSGSVVNIFSKMPITYLRTLENRRFLAYNDNIRLVAYTSVHPLPHLRSASFCRVSIPLYQLCRKHPYP